MKLDMITRRVSEVFDYCATRFDDGIKYSVCHGGTHPLSPGPNGVTIGDVARYIYAPAEWWATPDTGDADALRWYGPFPTRKAASTFLVGARIERDMPAQSTVRGTSRLLRSA